MSKSLYLSNQHKKGKEKERKNILQSNIFQIVMLNYIFLSHTITVIQYFFCFAKYTKNGSLLTFYIRIIRQK